jgi:hypothetical protein
VVEGFEAERTEIDPFTIRVTAEQEQELLANTRVDGWRREKRVNDSRGFLGIN